MPRACLLLLSVVLYAPPARAAEIVVLTNENWAKYAPPGKEADCILGDYVLKSDRIWAVVAQPAAWRNANMTVRQVGGAVIDLTTTYGTRAEDFDIRNGLGRPNDQLSAFYPGMRRQVFNKAEIVTADGPKVVLVVTAPAAEAKPEVKETPNIPAQPAVPRQPAVRLSYELDDSVPFLLVRSTFTNTWPEPLEFTLEDDLRADNFDAKAKNGVHELFWVHDRYFAQAYGFVADKHRIRSQSDATRVSRLVFLPDGSDSPKITLKPGESYELVRRLIPGAHLLAVKSAFAEMNRDPQINYQFLIKDEADQHVAGADITVSEDDETYGSGRTNEYGMLLCSFPSKKIRDLKLTVRAPGRSATMAAPRIPSGGTQDALQVIKIPVAPVVVAEITNTNGGPIPCKVQFKGLNGTTNPNWGPTSAIHAVNNLYYSHTGKFTVPIAPGEYEAIISYGVEHDVVRVPLKVEKAQKVPLKAVLKRTVQSPGWVSADFHSHSSPSGDNTSEQRGRVLNLLCENIEFAPCTEHNRIDSYTPHLKALGVEKLMGTCTGIELTGTPLPLNHQNAFPLKFKSRTQDGGAPVTDYDSITQIRRLMDWDDGAEKLVQQNHPDIGWLFFDKDGNGEPDEGYKGGFQYMHVIEVHPISEILDMTPIKIVPTRDGKRETRNETIFNWLQLLNQGHRIPGVVNTDAHYNFHGSGGLFNFVRCDSTKTVGGEEIMGDIDPLDIVRHAKKGHIVMSTGPFLQVEYGPYGTKSPALPGDEVSFSGSLLVRVQCPNWFDIDRIEVLFNGRPDKRFHYTRKEHPGWFGDGVVKFDRSFVVNKEDVAGGKDFHIIVVAIGEESTLGEVMGPFWGKQHPVAISNPIYVDVDGGGFKANGDTLGAPLPVKGQKPVTEAKP